jgi:hypothetical protein
MTHTKEPPENAGRFRLLDDPAFAQQLGQRGYLFSDDGEIPALDQHISDLEALYQRVMP